MTSPDASISVRALNYMRGVHLPSYIGLRFLLDRLPTADQSVAITALVENLSYSDIQRMYSVKRFKCFKEPAVPEYRPYSVPAPTHALAEAYCLYHLQIAGLREKPSFVYSYRTPKSPSYQKNYEQFSIGYARRNDDVLSALDDEHVALVFDLKKFYPSVNAEKVVEEFISKIKKSELSAANLRVISKCAKACIQPKKIDGVRGLRVGPDMSHLLADQALLGLDSKMDERYPGRYFRYVDDMVVVVHKSRVDEERVAVKAIVVGAGFLLNDDKEAVASRDVWSGFKNKYLPKDGAFDPLSSFRFRLKLFLARKPGDKEDLSMRLREVGVFLPLDSLMEATRSSGWRGKVLHFFRAGWKQILQYRFDGVDDIVQGARASQSVIRIHMTNMMEEGMSAVPLTRRWQIQQARFLINRALYFLPKNELGKLAEFMDGIHELDETRAVATAISQSDFAPVALMPGPVASTAAHLSAIRGLNSSEVFPGVLNSGDPFIAADIAAHFAIRGFQSGFDFDGVTDDSGALLRFAFAESEVSGISPLVSYGQEIEWLGLGWSKDARFKAASSRLLPDEEVVLEALSLSSGYAS